MLCSKLSQIHPTRLRKDNFNKTLPVGKLVEILALGPASDVGHVAGLPVPHSWENILKIFGKSIEDLLIGPMPDLSSYLYIH